MPFRRGRPIIHTDKHEISWSNLVQDASTVDSTQLATGTDPANVNLAHEVVRGAKITSIYFEFHFSAETVTNPKVIHWTIEVAPSGMSLGAPNTYYNDSRAYVIKRGMEMLPRDVSTIFKRIFVVRIPPIYQRMKKNQDIQFRYICSSAEAINACGIAIYKSRE